MRNNPTERAEVPHNSVSARLSMAEVPDQAAIEIVVRSVFSTLQGDLSSKEAGLLAEVESLGRTIAAAKAEISALRVDDITDSHIPTATDELDAIVSHTASATNCILEVCETLDVLAESMVGAAAQQMSDATTRIYEACSFQDITGQRIGKVVLTLKVIEEKVAHILKTFGAPIVLEEPLQPQPAAAPGLLLNGPQLPVAAMGQTDIDKLLASFD